MLKKNQAIIIFTSVDSNNVSHKTYVALGKILFENINIAKELHNYETTINHKEGKIVLDVKDKNQFTLLMQEIRKIFKSQKLSVLRASYQELQTKEKASQQENQTA